MGGGGVGDEGGAPGDDMRVGSCIIVSVAAAGIRWGMVCLRGDGLIGERLERRRKVEPLEFLESCKGADFVKPLPSFIGMQAI